MKDVIADLKSTYVSSLGTLECYQKGKPKLNDLSVGEIELTMNQKKMVEGAGFTRWCARIR